MSTTIKLKKSSTAGDTPVANDLAVGEVAVNTADGKLFTKHTDNSIKTISAGPIYQATNTNNVAGVWEATIPEITAYEDGQIIAFYPNKINGVSGGTTFEINSLGAKNIKRPGSATGNLTTHYHGSNIILLRYNSSDDCFNVHADYNSTHDYNVRWNNYVIANNNAGTGTAWHGYQLVIEGIDGKFYPVTEGGSTGNTNTVSTAELRVGGTILLYENSANITAGNEATNVYESLRTVRMEHWNNRDSGWATDNKSVYLVATKNSNGNFVLDNTSYTSFLTQDLPTSDDGKYYIKIGWMDNTDDAFRLEVNHPIYIYKNGAIREWGGYASNADQLDGNEASAFATSAQGALADSAMQDLVDDTSPELGGDLDTNGNDIIFDASNYLIWGTNPNIGTHVSVEGFTNALNLNVPSGNTLQIWDRNLGQNLKYSGTFNPAGAVSLYYDNSKKFDTASTGISVTGDIAVSGTVDGRDVATDGTKLDGIESGATADQTKADIDALGINADQVDGIEASSFLRSDATDTATGALTFGNSVTLNGSQTGGYPSLILQPGSTSTAYILMGDSADPDEGNIQYTPMNNTMYFTAGTNNVLNLTGTTIEANKDIVLPDDEYVKFGDSNDLTIGHGSVYGTNTIDSTQSLYVSTDNSIQFRKGNFQGENLANFNVDGSVDLYHNNVKKLETEANGVLVSGNVRFGGSDHGQLNFVSGSNPPVFSPQFSDHIVIKNVASATEQELYLLDTGDGNNGEIFGIASNNAPIFAVTGNSALKLMNPNTSSYDITIQPTTPTANRTLTLPNATGGVEVLKKTDFNLTPGASSVTLSISDVILSGTPRQNRILFCMDTMTPSSGPNNPILSIGHTSGTVSWTGSYAYTTGIDGQISGTDLLAGLTNYNYPYDGWTVELIRTNGNTWIVKVQAGLGSSGTYFATCKASAYLTGITIQTGSSYTWSAIKGSLYEYY